LRRAAKQAKRKQRGSTTLYLHPLLEAKLVAPCGLALSVGTEFIENPAAEVSTPQPHGANPATLSAYQKVKQDCELKAFARLAPALKRDFPPSRTLSDPPRYFLSLPLGPAPGLAASRCYYNRCSPALQAGMLSARPPPAPRLKCLDRLPYGPLFPRAASTHAGLRGVTIWVSIRGQLYH